MVHMVGEIKRIVTLAMQDFVYDEVVPTAKHNAPVDTGHLSQHIYAYQVSDFHWIVTTNSRGWNGVEYPARIEFGEEVLPSPGNTRGIWFHKKWHPKARATSQPHFMRNTVEKYGGH